MLFIPDIQNACRNFARFYAVILLIYVQLSSVTYRIRIITRKPSIEAGIRRNAICYSI